MKFSILVCVGLAGNVLGTPPVVDDHLDMDRRINGYTQSIPLDRPYWIEVTRTTTSNSGWAFLTIPNEFGMPFNSLGTTLGFYDDVGALLFTNRQASPDYAGSLIGFGTGYSSQYGTGSPNVPNLNRHYYLGIAGVDRDFLPNYGFSSGNDSGRFVASITPSPPVVTALLGLGVSRGLRRRR